MIFFRDFSARNFFLFTFLQRRKNVIFHQNFRIFKVTFIIEPQIKILINLLRNLSTKNISHCQKKVLFSIREEVYFQFW